MSSGSWGACERQNSAQSGRPARESGNRAQRNFAAAWPRRKPSVDRWGRGLRRFKTTPQRRRSWSLIERGVDRAGRSAAHLLPSPQRAAQSTTVWVHPLSGRFSVGLEVIEKKITCVLDRMNFNLRVAPISPKFNARAWRVIVPETLREREGLLHNQGSQARQPWSLTSWCLCARLEV